MTPHAFIAKWRDATLKELTIIFARGKPMDLWMQWATLVSVLITALFSLTMLIPKLIKVSDALRAHLGEIAWNMLFVAGFVIFLVWTGAITWVTYSNQQREREIEERLLNRIIPALERALPEEPDEIEP